MHIRIGRKPGSFLPLFLGPFPPVRRRLSTCIVHFLQLPQQMGKAALVVGGPDGVIGRPEVVDQHPVGRWTPTSSKTWEVVAPMP